MSAYSAASISWNAYLKLHLGIVLVVLLHGTLSSTVFYVEQKESGWLALNDLPWRSLRMQKRSPYEDFAECESPAEK